jgi:hypothetical protein
LTRGQADTLYCAINNCGGNGTFQNGTDIAPSEIFLNNIGVSDWSQINGTSADLSAYQTKADTSYNISNLISNSSNISCSFDFSVMKWSCFYNGTSSGGTVSDVWVNETGDKMTGNLLTQNLTVDYSINSTRDESYIAFEDDGDIAIWI